MAQMILPAIIGIGGSMLASTLLSPKQQAPAAAQAQKVMPMADDEAVNAAKRRSMLMQMNRGGRTSTMLTADSDTLGN